jgi:SAM-dependent methyltransferase
LPGRKGAMIVLMGEVTTSFQAFAEEYDRVMGDTGDSTHFYTIDPALFEAIGSVRDKTVYDIGCGNGYVARRCARDGASEVWASDVTPKMIEIAKTKYDPMSIKYSVRDGSDFSEIPRDYFDIVFANMVVHYLDDFSKFCRGARDVLKTGGIFVFTIPHPLEWLAWADAKKKDLKTGEIVSTARDYGRGEKIIPSPWLKDENLKIFMRTVSFYINICAGAGFIFEMMIEKELLTTADRKIDSEKISSGIPDTIAVRVRKS